MILRYNGALWDVFLIREIYKKKKTKRKAEEQIPVAVFNDEEAEIERIFMNIEKKRNNTQTARTTQQIKHKLL